MLENNFGSFILYDYETEYTCGDSGCNTEGICRCGKIYDIRITGIDINSIADDIYTQLILPASKSGKRHKRLTEIFSGGSEVDLYCIHRILTHNLIWDKDKWNIGISSGYYGEEIGNILLNENAFDKISDSCDKMISLETIADKIKYVLNLEYGYVLDELESSDFEIIEIRKKDIDFKKMNQNHISDVEKKKLNFYSSDYVLPRGIVRKLKDGYTIIDGYHRIISGENRVKVFCVK